MFQSSIFWNKQNTCSIKRLYHCIGNVSIEKANCLKQKAVAKKAGYDEKVFSNMLNGRKNVTDVDVAKIASALNVPPGELFDMKNEEISGEVKGA